MCKDTSENLLFTNHKFSYVRDGPFSAVAINRIISQKIHIRSGYHSLLHLLRCDENYCVHNGRELTPSVLKANRTAVAR